MENILKQLTEIQSELKKPFPSKDMEKIKHDFHAQLLILSDEENELKFDFNDYCMNIAGTLSYVLTDDITNIPENQIEMLHKSFFDYFNQYSFFEDKIEAYNDFFQEYKTFEQARKMLLQLLTT